MKILAGLLFALFSVAAYAKPPNGEWNWYYAAFNSPLSGKVFLRSGTATVKISKSALLLQFMEKDYPEMQASFSGRFYGAKNVRGTLKGFFPSGADNFSGTYRKMGGMNSCHWQEFILRPSVPDGAVLVLSKVEGACQ